MKLLAIYPDIKDATCFYRGIGPLQALAKQNKITLVHEKEIAWYTLRGAHALFYQRPFHAEHLRIIKAAKDNGLSVWVDYDDNLFALHPCNSQYDLYNDPTVTNNIVQILGLADAVTVTTEALAAVYHPFSKNITVTPNAYDEELMPDLTAPRKPRTKTAVWRGGTSHGSDLYTFMLELEQLASWADERNCALEFIGNPFWLVMQRLKKYGSVKTTPAIDIIKYFKWLTDKAPEVVMVPLEDTVFNRSKSNCAWLEATGAGAVTVAPDWGAWDMSGVLPYIGAEEFKTQVIAALDGGADWAWDLSRTHILEYLTLAKVNQKRIEILESL